MPAPLPLLASPLDWLGRRASAALAVSIVIGIAVPPLGALLAPYLSPAVFALLAIAFMRIDPSVAAGHLRRPGWALVAIAWTSLLVPALFAFAGLTLGVDARSPALFQGLMLHGIASPMMAAPAFAAMMGLDATLVLIALIGGSALLPITAPLFAAWFMDASLAITPARLGWRLLALLGGAAVLGLALRHALGARAIRERAHAIDGINVLVLYVFVAAVMKDVGAQILTEPARVASIAALAFGVFAALLALSTALFWLSGPRRALSLGFMASQRNMGLMVAGAGGALPELAWLYFAMSQLPIYVAPWVFQPLRRHVAGPPGEQDR